MVLIQQGFYIYIYRRKDQLFLSPSLFHSTSSTKKSHHSSPNSTLLPFALVDPRESWSPLQSRSVSKTSKDYDPMDGGRKEERWKKNEIPVCSYARRYITDIIEVCGRNVEEGGGWKMENFLERNPRVLAAMFSPAFFKIFIVSSLRFGHK